MTLAKRVETTAAERRRDARRGAIALGVESKDAHAGAVLERARARLARARAGVRTRRQVVGWTTIHAGVDLEIVGVHWTVAFATRMLIETDAGAGTVFR